ncbi:hypothetical protein ACO0QE_002677 [Hanseniaspora vineae]
MDSYGADLTQNTLQSTLLDILKQLEVSDAENPSQQETQKLKSKTKNKTKSKPKNQKTGANTKQRKKHSKSKKKPARSLNAPYPPFVPQHYMQAPYLVHPFQQPQQQQPAYFHPFLQPQHQAPFPFLIDTNSRRFGEHYPYYKNYYGDESDFETESEGDEHLRETGFDLSNGYEDEDEDEDQGEDAYENAEDEYYNDFLAGRDDSEYQRDLKSLPLKHGKPSIAKSQIFDKKGVPNSSYFQPRYFDTPGLLNDNSTGTKTTKENENQTALGNLDQGKHVSPIDHKNKPIHRNFGEIMEDLLFHHPAAPSHPITDLLQVSSTSSDSNLPFSPLLNVYDFPNSYSIVVAVAGTTPQSLEIDFHPSTHELILKGSVSLPSLSDIAIEEDNKKDVCEEKVSGEPIKDDVQEKKTNEKAEEITSDESKEVSKNAPKDVSKDGNGKTPASRCRIAELRTGHFQRIIKFPLFPKIDDENIKANYTNNGYLIVKLRKLSEHADSVPKPKKTIRIEDIPDEDGI